MNKQHFTYVLLALIVIEWLNNLRQAGFILAALAVAVPFAWLFAFSWRGRAGELWNSLSTTGPLATLGRPNVGTVLLAAALAWGMAPVFVTVAEALNYFFLFLSGGNHLAYYVLRAGVVEEALKFSSVLILLRYFYPDAIKHPIDGAILACGAALGFAAYENLNYNLNLITMEHGVFISFMQSALIRMPIHALYGSIWGLALGYAWFIKPPMKTYITLGGLAAAAFLHGLWDTMAQSHGALAFMALMIFYALLWHLLLRYWAAVRDIELVTKT